MKRLVTKSELARELFREMTEQHSQEARLVLADLLMDEGLEKLGLEVRRHADLVPTPFVSGEYRVPTQRVLDLRTRIRRAIGDLPRAKPRKRTSDVYRTEEIARTLGIPTPEDYERDLFDADLPEEEEVEEWRRYHNAVSSVATTMLERVGLDIVEIPRRGLFRIVPATRGGWARAADSIREVINGSGPFHFSNLNEFLRSGPYTAREAVLSHTHWIRRYSEVYGDANGESLFRRAMRW